MDMVNKFIKYLTNERYRFSIDVNLGKYNKWSDEAFLIKRYEYSFGRKLNLESPTLFNEKMQWLKLYDRNPLYTKIVDKYRFKEYVSEIVGEGYVFPTLGVYEKFDDINFEELPNEFVMKTNHDSGGVIICRNKQTFNKKAAKKKIEAKLKRNYYWICREWCYKNVKPLILIEPYISCKNSFNTDGLVDYKFYCFSGKPLYVMASFGEAEHKHINHKYDIAYNSIDLQFRKESLVPANTFPKPKNYEKMVEIVTKLCVGFPHIRVDLYNIDGKIYVGEMTLYSNGGFLNIPIEKDRELGEATDLKMAYSSIIDKRKNNK